MPRIIFFRFFSVCLASSVLVSPAAFAKAPDLPPAQSYAGAYLAGRVASSDGNADMAIDYLRQAFNFKPNDVHVEQDLMLILLSVGRFNEAVPLASKLRDDTDFSHLVLAADAFNKKRYKTVKAELDYDKDEMRDRLVSGLISAWATFGQGNRKAAIHEVARLDGPVWYDLFRNYHLALMYDLNGQKAEAEKAFSKAFRDQEGGAVAPDTYERVIVSYAAFKLANKDRNGAVEILKKGTELLSGRNVLLNMRKDIEAGKKVSRVISSVGDGGAEVLYNIGTAINRAGGEIYARLYLNIALAMRPKDDATLFQLAELALKSNQNVQAVGYYRQISQKSLYSRDSEMRLALTLADMGKPKEAITLLEGLNGRYPDDERIIMALSGVYMQQEDFASAAKTLDSFVDKLTPPTADKWSFFYQRGIAYERLKQWDKAEPNFRSALELVPDQPQVLNYLGYSLIDRNMKLDEALGMVRKAADLRPQDGYIIDSLGWAYYKLGRYEKAVKELERAIKLRPEDATINDHLGDAYWRVGRKLEATFQWNHALASKPEDGEQPKIEEKLKHGLNDVNNEAVNGK